jgi:sulfide:quinone oxidoreductase
MATEPPENSSRPRVVIAGGGVAAIEAMLALRDMLGDGIEIALYAPRAEFAYRPLAVGEPFGAAEILRFDLGELAAKRNARFVLASVVEVDGEGGQIRLQDGDEVAYDHLVLAAGVKPLVGVEGAATFWGVSDEPSVAEVIRDLEMGRVKSLVFTMPAGSGWPFPLYELALLTRERVRSSGIDHVELTVVTPEEAPLQVFGVRASEAVSTLLAARKIDVVAATRPVKYAEGRLQVVPGEEIGADAVISLPQLEGRRIGGVPCDQAGFIPVDAHGRVAGLDGVYAAGDITAFPIKQGGLATQQADGVAEMIARELGAAVEPTPFTPVLRGVLMTGEEPRYLTGELTGGHGETSVLTEQMLWWPPGKVAGKYIAPFLASLAGSELQPPRPTGMDPVEIDLGESADTLTVEDPGRAGAAKQ